MKIRVWTVLWTIIRKARNLCSQDVDHCGDEDHCQTGNHCQDSVRMEMSIQIDDQDQWSALKYN